MKPRNRPLDKQFILEGLRDYEERARAQSQDALPRRGSATEHFASAPFFIPSAFIETHQALN